jgi:hypothetical protein
MKTESLGEEFNQLNKEEKLDKKVKENIKRSKNTNAKYRNLV